METILNFNTTYTALLLPLMRLCLTMAIGLLIATLLEAMHWTHFTAKMASPLVRLARLSEASGAAFSLAFISPAAANALLAKHLEEGKIRQREVILANIFNSTPAYLVHLPTLLSIMYAFLGVHAFTYVGLTLLAATLRTASTVLVARSASAKKLAAQTNSVTENNISANEDLKKTFTLGSIFSAEIWKETVIQKALTRYFIRIKKLLIFAVPVYCLVFFMQQVGWFKIAEDFLAANISIFTFLDPKTVGIIALYIPADSSLALSAAAPLLASGDVSVEQVIIALLIGNIFSSPMRAFRHQLPAYAGYFKPRLAFQMVFINQLCRALSLCVVVAAYVLWQRHC